MDEIEDKQEAKFEIKQESGNLKEKLLVFEHRKTLPKKYRVALCHGSRLICDHDVYDKNYDLIQVLDHPDLPKINSICSYDSQYILLGSVCYFICLLRWDHGQNQYKYIRRFRFEKSTHGEGDFTHLERVHHLPQWIIACTQRTLRTFQLQEVQKVNK